MAKYYPGDYYSFQKHGSIKTFLRRRWSVYGYEGSGLIGKWLSDFFVPNDAIRAVRRTGVLQDSRILDIGCGSGRLLLDLAYLGFKNLEGADPFIPKDIRYPNGVVVFKRTLVEMSPGYDLVMLHHSFEHMDQPRKVLLELYRLLKPGGKLVIRIPIVTSYAWNKYGIHWVNLDAPRHFFLHSYKSIEILTREAGFRGEQIKQEGNHEQIWASEQYQRDIPYNDPRSIGFSMVNRLKHWKTIRTCKRLARDLNAKSEADLVAFHFSKPV